METRSVSKPDKSENYSSFCPLVIVSRHQQGVIKWGSCCFPLNKISYLLRNVGRKERFLCGTLEDGSLSPRHLCWPFAIYHLAWWSFSLRQLSTRHHLNSLTAQSAPSQSSVSRSYSAVHCSQQLKIWYISCLSDPMSIPSLNFLLLIFWTWMVASCDDSGSLFVFCSVPKFPNSC